MRSRPVAEKGEIAGELRERVWPLLESRAVKVLVDAKTKKILGAAILGTGGDGRRSTGASDRSHSLRGRLLLVEHFNRRHGFSFLHFIKRVCFR